MGVGGFSDLALDLSRCLRESVSRDRLLSGALRELVLYGSIVRGDYIPEISDVDLFYVLDDSERDRVDSIDERLREHTSSCMERLNIHSGRGVDTAWCFYSEVAGDRHDLCDFKFLTLYRGDFERFSIIVYGEPIHRFLRPPPLDRSLLMAYNRLRSRFREWRGRDDLLPIVAGELIKLLLIVDGYRGPLSKYAILNQLRSSGRNDLADYWARYIGGGKQDLDKTVEIINQLFRAVRNRLGIRG